MRVHRWILFRRKVPPRVVHQCINNLVDHFATAAFAHRFVQQVEQVLMVLIKKRDWTVYDFVHSMRAIFFSYDLHRRNVRKLDYQNRPVFTILIENRSFFTLYLFTRI
jgi:hypothetical protein